MRKGAKKTRWPNQGGVNHKNSFDIINNLVSEEHWFQKNHRYLKLLKMMRSQ